MKSIYAFDDDQYDVTVDRHFLAFDDIDTPHSVRRLTYNVFLAIHVKYFVEQEEAQQKLFSKSTNAFITFLIIEPVLSYIHTYIIMYKLGHM